MFLRHTVVWLIATSPAILALGQDRPAGRPTFNPTFDVSTLRPFTEGAAYLDKYETRLYPGSNEIPQAHQEAGVRLAATIQPLDVGGKPDAANGKILALVMGHSNCRLYFDALGAELKKRAGELHPRFELLNASVGGQQLPELRTFAGPVYERAKKLLAGGGYAAAQVQVLFLHTTYHGAGNVGNKPPRPFPQGMQSMQADLAALLEHCVKLYPNLKIAYLTSDGLRHYTCFEPHVWQEAFAFKWLIESQIKGQAAAAFEDQPGRPRRLPWLQWGPYIWDNTWDRSYFSDGVHPVDKARAIFVQKYWALLSHDPVARPWLLKPKN
jgi:hypothetical protein